MNGTCVPGTQTPVLAPSCLLSPSTSNPQQLFVAVPSEHPRHPPTSAIALSHLGNGCGRLSQIPSLPLSESCSVFLISFGTKPDGLQSSVLCSPMPLTSSTLRSASHPSHSGLSNRHPGVCHVYLGFCGLSPRLRMWSPWQQRFFSYLFLLYP